jgi:hypothetical protein
MSFQIKQGDDVLHVSTAGTVSRAIEEWMEGCDPSELEDYHDVTFRAVDDDGNSRFFVVTERNDDFYADPVDDKGPLKEPGQTFHLGLSCYGPNGDGKFRGAISVDSVSLFSAEFDTLDDARAETTGKLLEFITRTLGFSRQDAIEEISKEASHGRQTDRHAGAALDGQEHPCEGTGGG